MDLETIVRIYKEKYLHYTEEEIEWFRKQPNLQTAVETAAMVHMNERRKRYSHQYRLTEAALLKATQALLGKNIEIDLCKNFDELFSLVNAVVEPIKGVGELYVYDTSFRIGAYLGLFPEKVYIHSGTRVGAKTLFGIKGNVRTLEKEVFPDPFQELEPYEIEDVLCILDTKFTRLPMRSASSE